MKLLIINGSPHKGNTWKLAELVKRNINSFSTEVEFEEVHLNNIQLPLCTGCSQCFRNGHKRCPHFNIMGSIMEKIEHCDGIVFSVTTFQMHVPALTKNFTDHMCFMLHRPRYFDKKALIVSTTGGVGARGATQFMADTFAGWGFNRCYQLPISTISWNNYEPKPKDINKCLKITRKFYEDVSLKKLHSPSFAVLIPFNLFRGMREHYKPGQEYETMDGIYWDKMGVAKEAYSSQIPLPLHKKLFGNFFYVIAKVISKNMIVTYKK